MQIVQRGERTIVEAQGELDLSNARELRDLLDQAIQSGSGDVVLDITKALYIDSAVLQELIRSHNILSKQDRQFIVLARPDSQPGQVLHTVMFHTIMLIAGSLEELDG